MKETTIGYRNKISHTLYTKMLKPLLFSYDPESVHDKMTEFGSFLGRYSLSKKITAKLFGYENPMLEQTIGGVLFKNPVGLSAGFDKNAQLTTIMSSVGFGFVEVGSVTGEACVGNPKPRLWRLPKSKSLNVYYGLKNDGCDAVAKKLKSLPRDIPVGVSVAMTNSQINSKTRCAVADIAKAFKVMEPVGDYCTINISCPNTISGQPFLSAHSLDYLLDVVDEIHTTKPVFIKLSPDMTTEQVDALLLVAHKHRVSGIIVSNLTKKRDNRLIVDKDLPDVGGLSGKVVQNLADDMLGYIYKKEKNNFILIGSGGIFTAEDAYKKIRRGASLVQLITGMVFEGPQLISDINYGLVKLLRRDGFSNISQAIGVDIC